MTRQLLAAAAVLFAAALVVASVSVDAEQAQARTPAPPTRGVPAVPAASQARPAPPGALPPLPSVSFEPVRPMPVVQQVYEFAARHPEVLAYIPCYCGCERIGHKANHDCFVKSRATNGRITEWDTHGMGCAICLDVGRQAMTLFNQGMSVPAIRAAIEKTYNSHFPSHTPTPLPPKTSAKG